MKEMTAYAASLTGATGKALDAETITVGPKRLIKLPEEDSPKTDKQEKASSKSKKEEKEVWKHGFLSNTAEVLTFSRTKILRRMRRRARRKLLLAFQRKIR